MSSIDLARAGGRLRGHALAILAILAVGGSVADGGMLLHLHVADSAGIYNEEHVLAALDSAAGAAPLPDRPTAAGIAPSSDPVLPQRSRRSSPPRRATPTRARLPPSSPGLVVLIRSPAAAPFAHRR